MLTLRGILKGTPRYIKNNAKTTNILRVSKIKTSDGHLLVKARVQSDPLPGYPKNTKPKYLVTIESLNADKTSKKRSSVKMSCECDFFVFYGVEYVLNSKGAAEIVFSNGKPPNIRNPGQLIFPCKHLFKLGLHVIRNKM